MRKQTACALQRKGIHQQARVGEQWGSNPQPSTIVLMNNKLNSKKNELWKMKLSK